MEKATSNPSEKLAEIHSKKTNTSKNILVIGAGISGIVAAYELEKLGHNVQLIEASGRIGGRLWTFHFDGSGKQYGELGAMRIPADHDYVFYYIKEAGLESRLTRFVSALNDPNCFVDMEGKVNKLRDSVKGSYPQNVVMALKLAVNGISPPTIRELFTTDVQNSILNLLLEAPYNPLLDEYVKKMDPRFLQELDPLIKQKGNKGVNLFYKEIVTESAESLQTLDGGMDLLPKELVKKLKQPVLLNCEVQQIEVEPDCVKVTVKQDGAFSMMKYEYVVCTIPYSILKNIPFIGCEPKKLTAINDLHYINGGKLLLYCKEPFWQKDGIKGGATFTDHMIRQVYYPSNGSSVLLASYTLEDDCDKLGCLDLFALYNYAKTAIGRFHPQILEKGMIKDFQWVNWGEYRWSKGCGGVFWDNTMIENNEIFDTSSLRDLVFNASKPEGGLFFAGEHVSINQAWIQGSIISAVKTVEALQDCILGKEYLHHFVLSETSKAVAKEMRL